MIVDRPVAREVRALALLASLSLVSCSGLMHAFGGGMTPELQQSGVSATAQILEIWDTGWTINDSPVIGMRVRVQPPDRPDFEATIAKTTISRIAVPQFQPGAVIPVRFDPDNPALVAVDPEGGSSQASAPSSGNPYRDRFERSEMAGAVFLPPPATPQLYLGTGDMTTDVQTLFENEYAMLGGSSVRNAANLEQAVEQGREIGAALVVVYGHFTPPPGTTLEVLPLSRRAASGRSVGSAAGATRFLTGSLGPEDQFASYWGKTRPGILGIVSRPLDAEEQARLRRHGGIVVETVLSGSPAAAAGIAVGDVVVAIGGRTLADPRAVPEILTALAGQQVGFDLIRDGSPMSVTVQLNRASP
jgi:hypothetical protein